MMGRQAAGWFACATLLVLVLCLAMPLAASRAADAGFKQFLASIWPDAQKAGVSRATFEAVTTGLEPDYKLPDLILPGRPATGAPSQAEFVQVPADYIKEKSIARLAAGGQRLMQQYRPTLTAIEKRFGVPATIILAIWGRETDYGRYALPYDAIRVLATQAYVGRRKEQYRKEFIDGLLLLQHGDLTPAEPVPHVVPRQESDPQPQGRLQRLADGRERPLELVTDGDPQRRGRRPGGVDRVQQRGQPPVERRAVVGATGRDHVPDQRRRQHSASPAME